MALQIPHRNSPNLVINNRFLALSTQKLVKIMLKAGGTQMRDSGEVEFKIL